MALTPGTRLGPYDITSRIGAGGMGEVYQAVDTRLDRKVAIKVSSEQFSERFEREARAVAALNHSHICQLYDVGPNYLVMEYIEGAPLKGPLPLDLALKYAAQICDALDAAHKKGIVHRDLKPGNILVTKSGVKLLDFGLAKIAPAAGSAGDATLTMALTGKNEIVGTLYYMSPEQLQAHASGKEIDARSDIFSFGLVLYEMLTGKRAFEGASPASVIAAIIERPAPSITDVAPPALDRVLKTCLAKDPEERWQTARDLKRELEWIANASGAVTAAPAVGTRHRLLPWVAAGMMAIGAAALGLGYYRATRPAELKPLMRLDVDLGPDVSLDSLLGANAILSPDGTRLAYVSRGRLFIRKLDQPKATELAGTEGAFAPFFSPDGQWVGFFTSGKLKKVSVEGGSAIDLCNVSNPYGGGWGEDDNIIASIRSGNGLSRISSAGGVPARVTELAQGEATQRWPQVLRGGEAVLYTAHTAVSGFDEANIEVTSLKDHRSKILVRGGMFGRYVPSGHLIYLNRGTLFAVPFDVDKLEVRGTSTPVLAPIGFSPGFGWAALAYSQTGTLVYWNLGSSGMRTVQWLDSSGAAKPLLAKPDGYIRPSLSPDGSRLAISAEDIWVYEWKRDTLTRLTFGPGVSIYPMWSPDGRYILFQSAGGIFWTRSDGSGKPQPLTQSKNLQYPWSFTPDGKRLSFHEQNPETSYDIWTVGVESDSAGLRAGKPEPFLQTAFDERHGTFSPDGRWIAYSSNESGAFQVYVRAYPDKGGTWQISNNGGVYPVWSRNGRELFFRTNDNQIMVASYTAKGDSFMADKPRVWSEKKIANVGLLANYDLAPDGKRIVALMPAETQDAQQDRNHVIFLENFFDELRRKVPLSGR